ncbi:MAG: hypothetical protein ACI9IT_001555, partial [Glaciecola sp.]
TFMDINSNVIAIEADLRIFTSAVLGITPLCRPAVTLASVWCYFVLYRRKKRTITDVSFFLQNHIIVVLFKSASA